MAIEKDDVRHIARLSRLMLGDKEFDYFADQLQRIVNYIDQLKEVDTADTEPTSHVLSLRNVFRQDVIGKSLPKEDALKNAPSREGWLFKVPKIIEDI